MDPQGQLHDGPRGGDEPEAERLPLPFGKAVRKEFLFDPDYHPLNHGSFGTVPAAILARLRHYQQQHERAPDTFIRYTYPALLDENRAAAARLLGVRDVDELVFVPNATVGINTVLRSLTEAWDPTGTDEIILFSTVYGGIGKTVDYVADTNPVRARAVELAYPVADADVLERFRAAVATSRAEGRNPRVAVFDTVSSVPGVRFPHAALVRACRELGVLSMVDGAQGVGMIPLDLGELDPDFFVTNCHKWLFVPRGCAVLYVPLRNQHLIRSSLPTSHGYVGRGSSARANPLPPSEKSAFVNMFEFVGTLDSSPYLCVGDAIEWRKRVLGGEERIREYTSRLAREGGLKVAQKLETWVLQSDENPSLDCALTNIALPVVVAPETDGASEKTVVTNGFEVATSRLVEADVEETAPANNDLVHAHVKVRQTKEETIIPHREAQRIWAWMTKVLVDEYKTFIPIFYHAGRFWARLSAQVYLDVDDFDWAGKTLKELCKRVANKEYDQEINP